MRKNTAAESRFYFLSLSPIFYLLYFTLLMILAGIVILINQEIVLTAVGVLIIVYGILDIVDRFIFMKKINDYMKD